MMSKLGVVLCAFLFAAAAAAELSGPANVILVPAAGSIAGANGTFFRSDITLMNFRGSAQRVALRWLAQSNDPSALVPRNTTVVTIQAYERITSEDFVTDVLHVSGLGAILITGVTANDDVDTDALLFATSRIWTPQPGSAGTVSQSSPILAVNAKAPPPPLNATILGQRIDSRFRTNVGIVNLDPWFPRTFSILQNTDIPTFAPVTTVITVPPLSMHQVKLFDMPATVLQISITAGPEPAVGAPVGGPYSGFWFAYGSTVDNVTGDSWSSLAMPLLKP